MSEMNMPNISIKAGGSKRSTPRPLHEILMRELLANPGDKAFKEVWSKLKPFDRQRIVRAAGDCCAQSVTFCADNLIIILGDERVLFEVEHLAVLGLACRYGHDKLFIDSPLSIQTRKGDIAAGEAAKRIADMLNADTVPGGLALHNYLETRALSEVKRRRRLDG